MLAHPTIVGTATLHWPDEAACAASAARLAAAPALRDAFVALHGDLGAGKTTFVRHLLRALGVGGRIKSPTYAVVEPYDTRIGPAWHFDFYRFSDPREWEDAGFRDIFAGAGLKLAEWPDKAAGMLPQPDLTLTLAMADDGAGSDARVVTARAQGDAGLALMAALGAQGRPDAPTATAGSSGAGRSNPAGPA